MRELKKFWVCVTRDGDPFTGTIDGNRRASINKLQAMFTGAKDISWKQFKKYGWSCKKVNIKFTEV